MLWVSGRRQLEVEHGYRHIPDQEREIDAQLPVCVRSPGRRCPRQTCDGYATISDMPDELPITPDEVALLRTFLSAEINAIIYGDEEAI